MHDGLPDFDAIRSNAEKDGIDLSEIAILYEGLSAFELFAMREAGLVARESEAIVLGRFAADGTVMFQAKAVGVISLSAT